MVTLKGQMMVTWRVQCLYMVINWIFTSVTKYGIILVKTYEFLIGCDEFIKLVFSYGKM